MTRKKDHNKIIALVLLALVYAVALAEFESMAAMIEKKGWLVTGKSAVLSCKPGDTNNREAMAQRYNDGGKETSGPDRSRNSDKSNGCSHQAGVLSETTSKRKLFKIQSC